MMGTIYEIVDRKNHRRFGLDKGDWNFAGFDSGQPMTLDEVRSGCVRASRGRATLDDIPERIWAFLTVAGWDVDIFDDTGDYSDYDMAHWPIVDDRCRYDERNRSEDEPFDPDPCEEQTRAALARAKGRAEK